MTGQWFCGSGWYDKFLNINISALYDLCEMRVDVRRFHPNLRWLIMLVDDRREFSHTWFSDVRKFGTLEYVENCQEYLPIKNLGPDGLDLKSDESKKFIEKRLLKSSKPIKNVLLDQTVIAGIGNIYASSILWEVGINPARPAKECVTKIDDLCETTVVILEEAIQYGGSSISDYLGGTYHEKLKVYGKDGHPCPRCSTEIIRITQSGRSTFYCPNCQQ